MKCEYVSHMGDDNAVCNAARVSMSKTADMFTKEQNEKLIHYLAKHEHTSPFYHTAITLRMGAPVPITVQCYKHKIGMAENGESRRYVSHTPELFIPEYFRSRPEGSIKQGSGDKHPDSGIFKSQYERQCKDSIELYEYWINEGMAPEQARFVLPQGVILNWIWTGSLYAFANFYNKRIDPHAQFEIQQLAHMVGDIVQPLFPISWRALTSND